MMRHVERLELGGNLGLTGRGGASLAAFFATAPNMTHFHAAYTALSSLRTVGDDPQLFTPAVCDAMPRVLISIRLGSGGVVGTIPSCLMTRHMQELQLQNNNLTGSLPSFLSVSTGNTTNNMSTSLRVLVLDNNTVSGPVPTTYATLAPNLTLISASNNQLTGQLPPFAQHTLHAVRLTTNRLTGTVPASLAGLPGMDAMDLSRNALTGTLPPGILTGLGLRDVSLRGNALTGVIPNMTVGPNVRYVDMSANLLSGVALPPALIRAPKLAYLYLEENLLQGPLLSRALLGNAPETYLVSVRVMDLGRNLIDGVVPTDFATLPVFTAAAVQVSTAAGMRILVHALDLSGNRLTGYYTLPRP